MAVWNVFVDNNIGQIFIVCCCRARPGRWCVYSGEMSKPNHLTLHVPPQEEFNGPTEWMISTIQSHMAKTGTNVATILANKDSCENFMKTFAEKVKGSVGHQDVLTWVSGQVEDAGDKGEVKGEVKGRREVKIGAVNICWLYVMHGASETRFVTRPGLVFVTRDVSKFTTWSSYLIKLMEKLGNTIIFFEDS